MKNIIVLFCLTMSFFSKSQDSTTIINDTDSVFSFSDVEVKPIYPGGDEALLNYLGRETHYPSEAVEEGIVGTVYLGCIIEKDGSVSNVKVLRPVDPLLDNEAIRVVSGMPDWKPGKHAGQNVRVSFNVPIKFILTGKASKKSKKR